MLFILRLFFPSSDWTVMRWFSDERIHVQFVGSTAHWHAINDKAA